MSLPELVGSQSRYGHSNLPDVEFFDDFLADVGVAAQSPWVEAASQATVDHISDADGILQLLLAGSGANTSRIDFGNSLLLDMSRLKFIEFGVRINFAAATLDASETIIIGLGTADTTAPYDATTTNLWFKLAGANVNILWESDDGTTDDDDNDSTIDIVSGALTVFRIEPGGSPGEIGCSPKMYVDGQEVGAQPVGGINMRSLAASTLVQALVKHDDTTFSVANSVDVDYVRWRQIRSTT